MGNSASKFKKHLQRGDEFAVMQLYERHSDIRKSLDANASYGENYCNNTPLHFASLHAMKFMLQAFLTDNGGNPNKRNAEEATALHLICQIGKRNRNIESKLRSDCLSVLLSWKGAILVGGETEKINLNAQDAKKNTPIHYAALSGLKKCVELLICKGASVFIENENKDSACDLAIKAGHMDVGEYLESKMLFAQECSEDLNEEDIFPVFEPFNGLREQDLREAKDLLLVETADMLDIPLFTAETLLKHHEWSRDALADAWMLDKVACCEKCGVLSKPHSRTHQFQCRPSPGTASLTSRRLSCTSNCVSQARGVACEGQPIQLQNIDVANENFIKNQAAEFCENRAVENGISLTCGVERPIENQIDEARADRFPTKTFGSVGDLTVSRQEGGLAAGHDLANDDDCPISCNANWSRDLSLLDEEEQETCEICAENSLKLQTIGSSECEHRFCRSCWKNYVGVRLQEGEYHGINCPAYGCSKLVPLELIEIVLSPTMARKFLRFDIKVKLHSDLHKTRYLYFTLGWAFVDSNPHIKWCPFPGCTNAVRLPLSDQHQIPVYLRVFPKLQPPPAASRTVSCPNSHSFCWECLADGHEPTSCEKWKEWHEKISEMKPEELKDTSTSSEMAANCLWLVTNSKPCPKCKSPIQKNDGCNHMKCSKCKHDFCWVCLGPWKKHSTETGGYFRCNRYDDSRKLDERTEQAIAEAKEQSKKTYELNRFVHYYARYKNHSNSHELEKPLINNIECRIENFVKFAAKECSAEQPLDFAFIKDSINELLRSRKVLSSSYAYGYFLKDCGYNKTIFEYLQNELEVSVELLSALVGRNYLRGSRQRITQTAQLVAGRRFRFVSCIACGLLPPETPPGRKGKGRKRGLPAILGLDKDDDDWSKTGYPKVDDFDPLHPWIRDARGKHHNLLTILDWPEEESDDDESPPFSPIQNDSSEGACARSGCRKKRAQNPRTGDMHRYCSLRCQHNDSSATSDVVAVAAAQFAAGLPSTSAATMASMLSRPSTGRRKYDVDWMIAYRMSNLQLLRNLRDLSRDQDFSMESSISRHFHTPEDLVYGDDEDADLQLAIERSVLDSVLSSSCRPRLLCDDSSMFGDLSSASTTIASKPDQLKSTESMDFIASNSEEISIQSTIDLCTEKIYDQSVIGVTNIFDQSATTQLISTQQPIDARVFDAYIRKIVEKSSASEVDERINLLKPDGDDVSDSGAVMDVKVPPRCAVDKVRKVLIKTLSGSDPPSEDGDKSRTKAGLLAHASMDLDKIVGVDVSSHPQERSAIVNVDNETGREVAALLDACLDTLDD